MVDAQTYVIETASQFEQFKRSMEAKDRFTGYKWFPASSYPMLMRIVKYGYAPDSSGFGSDLLAGVGISVEDMRLLNGEAQ
jgi:hypothetical protein